MTDKDFEKLVFGMAHQIRNPCAIIKSNANLLLQKNNLTPEMRHSLEAIVNGVKYLEERLAEFVEFSKPLRLNLKPVSLKQLLQQVVSMVRERAQMQKIFISHQVDEKLILQKVDSQQIFLALLNILINAIESMPQEGGAVMIRAELLRLSDEQMNRWSRQSGSQPVNQSTDGNFVKISIADTGCGIHPRDLPEVFSPFYSTKKGGIGIGLAVAKRIIDAHNGRISVASTQGKGTTVTIQLPLI